MNKARGKYLSFVHEGFGTLKPGTDPVDGIFLGRRLARVLTTRRPTRGARVKRRRALRGARHILSYAQPFYGDFKDDVARVLELFRGPALRL